MPDIADTIPEAAAHILSHSFAVYRVEAATASKIQAAHRAAVGFFNDTRNETSQASSDAKTNDREKQDSVEKYRRVKNGNLYGYNLPLQSKELFRTWYDCGIKGNNNDREEPDLEYFRRQQPWPSNEFCKVSFDLASDLHRLLLKCLRQLFILNGSHEEEETGDPNDVSVSQTRQGHSRQKRLNPTTTSARKRFRGSSSAATKPFDCQIFDSESDNASNDCGEKNRWGRCSFCPSNCPLDYFFYHNRFPNVINCSEHIDRGALVVVCLTDVPGLEVLSSSESESSSFVCPESLVHNANLYRERTDGDCCPGLVCIMAGDQFSQLLSSTEPPRGCVHRVRNPLLRSRLSISYELRLDL